jgi:hypothetical protein
MRTLRLCYGHTPSAETSPHSHGWRRFMVPRCNRNAAASIYSYCEHCAKPAPRGGNNMEFAAMMMLAAVVMGVLQQFDRNEW